MLSNYISLPIFLISFAIGLFCVYVIGPESKTIYVYPSPQNYMKTQYKDSSNQCFEFGACLMASTIVELANICLQSTASKI